MIRICYSEHHVGDRKFGEKEPLTDKSETHGLCDRCLEMEKVDIQRALKKLERAGFDVSRLFIEKSDGDEPTRVPDPSVA